MLILQRKEGEYLSINEGQILIKMVKVQGKYIRLGIEAPKEIQIDRGAQDGDHVCRCMHCGEKY